MSTLPYLLALPWPCGFRLTCMTGQGAVVCRLDGIYRRPTGPKPSSEHCQMGAGRLDEGAFPAEDQSEIPWLRGKVLLDAGDKFQAATITSHLPFKDECPHVWAMSGCQVGQQEEGAEEPANTARMSLVWCLEPIRLTDTTLGFASLPALPWTLLELRIESSSLSSAHPGLHFSLCQLPSPSPPCSTLYLLNLSPYPGFFLHLPPLSGLNLAQSNVSASYWFIKCSAF